MYIELVCGGQTRPAIESASLTGSDLCDILLAYSSVFLSDFLVSEKVHSAKKSIL